MSVPPLELTIPMVGIDGERDNVSRFTFVINQLVPKGSLALVSVSHDDECPCVDGELSIASCTCEEVGVRVELQ